MLCVACTGSYVIIKYYYSIITNTRAVLIRILVRSEQYKNISVIIFCFTISS